MQLGNPRKALYLTLCVSAAAWLIGCAGWRSDPDAYQTRIASPESAAALSGEALAQKKHSLVRLKRDLVQIRDTAMSLRRHRDARGRKQLDGFATAFVKHRIKPLVGARERDRNAELLPMDANLLFAEADLWIELRRHGRAARTQREIEKRFHGHEDLPVDYPLGERNTLGQALERLERLRKAI